MIRKELDEIKVTDKFSKAGIEAERQLAFYLKRAFEDDPKVSVLNGLRFALHDDFAQIDHLIIHKYGMIIVESKSVTGEIRINEREEWSRKFKSWMGMPSPIKQAERQKAFLQKCLDASGPKLPSDIGIRRTYKDLPIDILIAISDKANIYRPKSPVLDNVLKAERIEDKIRELIDQYQKEKGFLSLTFRPFTLSDDIQEEIIKFLIQAHTPLLPKDINTRETAINALPSNKSHTPPSPKCKECDSTNIKINWGQYGYYFKCDNCNKNTAIKKVCPICNRRMKLRKDSRDFFIECPACKTSVHFYRNPD